MKRIKSLKLGNHTIKVKYLARVLSGEREVFGSANPKTNEIHIALTMSGQNIAEDVIAHSLHHEVAHFIMILMNEWSLNENETFIDLLGGFMAQFNQTKR